MQFNGAALSKMGWGLSPFYTIALVYLLPLVMTYRSAISRGGGVELALRDLYHPANRHEPIFNAMMRALLIARC